MGEKGRGEVRVLKIIGSCNIWQTNGNANRSVAARAARALRWLTNGSRDVVSESSPEGLIWRGYKWRYLKSDKHDRTGRPSPSNREYGR